MRPARPQSAQTARFDLHQTDAPRRHGYLKGFLQNLIDQVKDIPLWQQAEDAQILAFVYQILGAINYYGISESTLTGIFGRDFYGELNANYPYQLVHLIDAALAAGLPR